ncbi:MAG: sulfatase-like hydrolase/transferase [bacterium]|nr:sulfatase-like hydrolase/transferase [bacterium]
MHRLPQWPTPYCSPTRASILTGLSPHRHGILSNVDMGAHRPGLDGGRFPVTENILYEKKGYGAGHWGKIHAFNTTIRPKTILSAPWMCNADLPCYAQWPAGSGPDHEGWKDDCETAARAKGYKSWGDWTRIGHVEMIDAVKPATGMGGFGPIGKSPVPAPYKMENFYGVEAMEAMAANRDRPWMFTLSYHPPHNPFIAPEPYYSMYDPAALTLPANQDAMPDDDMAKYGSVAGAHKIGEAGIREFLRVYYAQVTMIDDYVGKVLNKLDELGLADRTIVVFTSDHGDMAGSHGCVAKDMPAFFDYLIRVPLIIRYPGRVKPGTRVSELVTSMDIMPTLLDYAGAPIPAGIDGRSLRPLLEGQTAPWREWAYGEREYPAPVNMKTTQFMIRGKRWKYWWNQDPTLHERLYDLEADPLERRNLAADPAHREQLDRMRALLDRWLVDSRNPKRHFFEEAMAAKTKTGAA